MPTFSCPIVGTFEPMKDFLLPQKVDVLKDFYFRSYCSGLVTPQSTPKDVHIDEVLDRLLHIYEVSTIIEREGDYYKNCISKRAMSQAFNRLIDNITEPPLTIQLSSEEIHAFKDTPLVCTYPCHTQATERGVKLTTESVSRITKKELQIGGGLPQSKLKSCAMFKGERGRVCRKYFKPKNIFKD